MDHLSVAAGAAWPTNRAVDGSAVKPSSDSAQGRSALFVEVWALSHFRGWLSGVPAYLERKPFLKLNGITA